MEVSLLESVLDLQFEVVTTHLNDGGKSPQRSAVNNGHAYLGAPYGGWKQSGIGEEECFDELLSYTQVKNVHMRW